MTEEETTKLRLEIGHVLFMDIVGYSKLLMDEQIEVLHDLNGIVRRTPVVREAEADGKLILLPTGDGMVLVFTSSVEAPVECALQVSRVLRARPSLPLRMGVHSGAVQQIKDVNQRNNIAGAGINIAQRVMDCGDAGHILISKRVADDLATSRRWQPYLHELGECAVKHGVRLAIVNLCAGEVGNAELPKKFQTAAAVGSPTKRAYKFAGMALAAVLLAGLLVYPLVLRRAASDAGAIPNEIRSIAGLPLGNYTGDAKEDHFVAGMADQLTTDLAAVSKIARGETVGRADAENGRNQTMNILLWVLQVLAALLYGASGVMKVFMFDKISADVRSFGALPRPAWMALGILELVCTVGLIVPDALHWQPVLTVVAATVLALESLIFIGVHAKYREIAPIIMSGVLGLLMAFVAYGRLVLHPIF